MLLASAVGRRGGGAGAGAEAEAEPTSSTSSDSVAILVQDSVRLTHTSHTQASQSEVSRILLATMEGDLVGIWSLRDFVRGEALSHEPDTPQFVSRETPYRVFEVVIKGEVFVFAADHEFETNVTSGGSKFHIYGTSMGDPCLWINCYGPRAEWILNTGFPDTDLVTASETGLDTISDTVLETGMERAFIATVGHTEVFPHC